MESLGQTLKRIVANRPPPPNSYPKDNAAADEDPPVCSRCKGRGWLSVPKGEYSSDAVPCPVCHVRNKQDFFADLHIEDGNAEAIRRAGEFAARPQGWLVLMGGVGTGKTRLLNAILSTWRGQQRQAITAAELLDYWRMAMDTEKLGPVFNGYCTASAFVLDDLGAENVTKWGMAQMTMFVDFRYGRALPTVIATNLDRAGMVDRLGERIADRCFDVKTGLVRVVTLDVPSFRRG